MKSTEKNKNYSKVQQIIILLVSGVRKTSIFSITFYLIAVEIFSNLIIIISLKTEKWIEGILWFVIQTKFQGSLRDNNIISFSDIGL